jgi:hypothetical protein
MFFKTRIGDGLVQKKECGQKMNLMEATNEQLLEKLTELNDAAPPTIRNSPVLDGSMEALFELVNDGLTIHENARRGE